MKIEVTYWCKAPLRPGDVVDVPDPVAAALIRDNHAKPADAAGLPLEPVPEPTAVADDAESSEKRRRGRLPVPQRPKPEQAADTAAE